MSKALAASLAAPLATLALCWAHPASADASQDFVKAVSSNCWSCTFYDSVMTASNTLFGSMFGFFVGSAGFMSLTFACLGIVLSWRMTRFFAGVFETDGHRRREQREIYGFASRVGIVFLVFLTTSSANLALTPTSGSSLNPVRDLFLDMPLALGTGLGCQLANVLAQNGTLGSSSLQGPTSAGVACSATVDGTSWMASHIAGANAILGGFHSLGIGGMAVGVQTMTFGGTMFGAGEIGKRIALVIVGASLVSAFLVFTVTFGLRYIDAALRAMIALSLMPVFLILWIFDRTRPMAHAALRSVLFMGALFAASGVAYGFSSAIMTFGIETALGTTSIDPATLATKAVVHISSTGGAANVNYYSLMMMLGCFGVSIGIAGSAFKIAEELVSFNGEAYSGEIGIGAAAAGSMGGVVGNATDLGVNAADKLLDGGRGAVMGR